jgi:uncharacterized protein DUF4242
VRTATGWPISAAPSYVAECFWPGVTRDDLAQLDARVVASVDRKSRARDRVRYLGALLLPTDEVVFCFFDAPSADAVEIVARRANIPFDRILESVNVPRYGRIQRP